MYNVYFGSYGCYSAISSMVSAQANAPYALIKRTQNLKGRKKMYNVVVAFRWRHADQYVFFFKTGLVDFSKPGTHPRFYAGSVNCYYGK